MCRSSAATTSTDMPATFDRTDSDAIANSDAPPALNYAASAVGVTVGATTTLLSRLARAPENTTARAARYFE